MKDDTISRAAALTVLNGLTEIYLNNLPPTIDRADAIDAITALPSAQRWIPVTERQPEKPGTYLVTRVGYGWNGTKYTTISVRGYFSGEWDMIGIVAWMPLPEPWKGERK